jgi:ABC-2 type transport system permease protein
MSSTKFTEKTEGGPPHTGWQAPREMAPSTIVAAQPVVPRLVGSFGLVCAVLGGVTLALYAWYPAQGRLISPGWARVLVVLGFGGILYHALVDADVQVRRLYQVLGYALILLAVFLTWLPINEVYGSQFLPWGVFGYFLGLVFLLAFLRNETETLLCDYALYVIGALGGVMAIVGFVFSSFGPQAEKFLFSHGLLLTILGLLYGSTFVLQRPTGETLRYRAGIGMGLGGGLFFLIALYRSFFVHLYVMPAGLLLMGLGLLYVAVSVGLCSELPVVVLARRELTRFFCTPIAYIVLLASVLLSWLLFWLFVFVLINLSIGRPGMPGMGLPEPIVGSYLWGPVWFVPVISMLVIVPLLTMGLLSEEQRTGTMEMLLTVRASETTVVLGKFLAALTAFVLFWLPWSGYLISLRIYGEQPFDYQPLLSFYIAMMFLGANFIAMGLFFSSLTQNQLTSGILCFIAMMFLIVVYVLKRLVAGTVWADIIDHTSFIDLWENASAGKLPLRMLIYHASAAVFWLVLSVKVLEVRRWR